MPRLSNARIPICTIPTAKSTASVAPCGGKFLLLAERNSKIPTDANIKVRIGNHDAEVHKWSTFGRSEQEGVKSQEYDGNTPLHQIYVVDGVKIGLNALSNETIFNKRSNQGNILELAKMALQSDGIIVLMNHDNLTSKGAELYPIKVLDVLLFTLRQFCQAKLNISFVIYNYDQKQFANDKNKAFQKRYEEEIESSLKKVLKKESDMLKTSFHFTTVGDSVSSLNAIKPWVDDLMALRSACKRQLIEEDRMKDEIAKRIGVIQECMGTSVNDVASKLKGLDVAKDAQGFHQLLTEANAIELHFNKWMQEKGISLGEVPDKLKEQVDLLIISLLKDYDNAVKSRGLIKHAKVKAVRNELEESLRTKLAFLMDGIALKLQDAVLQEFQKHIQTFPVDDNLDLNLQDAIATYDSRYCRLVKAYMFDILKSSTVYKLKAQMQRRDVIENMKDVCNHVLEFAIGKGLFHSNISMLDGISYIPSNFISRFLKKWFYKLKIPLHISLNYLSPSAFGFSNLFRDRIPLKPGILHYFTGEKKHEMFSSDEATRRAANSLVRNES
ncbi:hypothetical protein BgAZ_103770 [Babesia gibsoni]|uniref:Uncharacterized protein n=1 Tax=Babesia gibsoni TaxID=33632 RepID=A0AAD8PFH6_BABGI|nr:hypothetical protein BgAZ_103770 [Babesia gibsoni]